ncbi:helix-turn-helix domain-containing protein [Deinococcus xianganensis]|nr:helix-turn-helix domain-containing protein [Deinococcus xianganensis]
MTDALSVLKTGKARAVRLGTLDALRRALDGQHGDLLRWEDNPPGPDGT